METEGQSKGRWINEEINKYLEMNANEDQPSRIYGTQQKPQQEQRV